MALVEIALITIAALMMVMAFAFLVSYLVIIMDECEAYTINVYTISLVAIYVSMIIVYMLIYVILLR